MKKQYVTPQCERLCFSVTGDVCGVGKARYGIIPIHPNEGMGHIGVVSGPADE